MRVFYAGRVGITLNVDWAVPLDDSAESLAASVRNLQFYVGWFAHPVFVNGDYPDVMINQVRRRFPMHRHADCDAAINARVVSSFRLPAFRSFLADWE